MLSDAITVGCNTVTRNTGSLLFRDILARLLQTALLTGQFLLQNVSTITIARLLGIFLHARKARR